MNKKFVVWGFPLHTHTHSYVHAAIYKAAKRLGYETFWFHDQSYPKDFDFENCIIWTEGYADSNLPIKKSSTYFVHVCVNPKKYLDKECRLIDVRYNVKELYDVNYNYVRDLRLLEKIDDTFFYQQNASQDALTNKADETLPNYEAIYLTWATDLFPEEIHDEFVDIPRSNKIYWIGTIGGSNVREIEPFALACRDNNIDFIVSNPWNNPIEFTDTMNLTQQSFLAPDIRGSGDHPVKTGTNHIKTGYVACRQFKNISYGQLGMTNSFEAQKLFDGKLIYNSDTYALFEDGRSQMTNKNLILEQMKIVREQHTWLKRLSSVLTRLT